MGAQLLAARVAAADHSQHERRLGAGRLGTLLLGKIEVLDEVKVSVVFHQVLKKTYKMISTAAATQCLRLCRCLFKRAICACKIFSIREQSIVKLIHVSEIGEPNTTGQISTVLAWLEGLLLTQKTHFIYFVTSSQIGMVRPAYNAYETRIALLAAGIPSIREYKAGIKRDVLTLQVGSNARILVQMKTRVSLRSLAEVCRSLST